MRQVGGEPLGQQAQDRGEGREREEARGDTARILEEAYASDPTTCVFNDFGTPGFRAANVDHLVVRGRRVQIMDSEVWAPGFYWSFANETRGEGGRFSQADRREANRARANYYQHLVGDLAHVDGALVIHPSQGGGKVRKWALAWDDPEVGGLRLIMADKLIRTLDRSLGPRRAPDPLLLQALSGILLSNQSPALVGHPWDTPSSGGLSAEVMGDQYRIEVGRLRAEADELERQAGNWSVGGQGERKTIALLAQLGPEWTVLHDRGLPNSNANVDHVLVGPGGVIVVDTKVVGRNLTALNGKLFWGRDPADDKLATTRWEAHRVAQILGRPGSVAAVWAVWGQDVPYGQSCGVTVLAAEDLLDYLAKLRPALSPSQSQRVAVLAERALPPR